MSEVNQRRRNNPSSSKQQKNRISREDSQRRPQRDTATARVSRVSKSKRSNDNRGMIVAIIMVVAMFCIVLSVQIFHAGSTLSKLKTQKVELENQYNQELELSEELKEKEDYVQTDEYIEEMARNLGLVYPDEVIFKPEE